MLLQRHAICGEGMPKCQVPRIIRDIRCMYLWNESRKYRQYVLAISDKVCDVPWVIFAKPGEKSEDEKKNK